MRLTDIADERDLERDGANAYTETLLSHSVMNDLISIAPHGGEMEPGTDKQAFLVASAIDQCSGWAYRGYVENGSARDRYYEKSTEISPNDYAFLPRLLEHQFPVGIAFHGYDPDFAHPDVCIGGTIGRATREMIAEKIRQRTSLDVVLSDVRGRLHANYGCTDEDNILNRLSDESLQLEQTLDVRQEHSEGICQAIMTGLNEMEGRSVTG